MGVIESKIEYSKLPVKDVEQLTWDLRRIGAGKVFAARGRGSRMSDFQSMSNELSACLHFPDYYGDNWDALNECMQDLEWLFAEEVFLAIDEFDLVFPGNDEDFRILMEILEDAIQEHGNNQEGNQKLRVILQITDEGYESLQIRLEKKNIRLSEFRKPQLMWKKRKN